MPAALLWMAPYGLALEGVPAARLKSIVTANRIRLAEAGIRIVSVKSGETLFESFGDKLFMPASNVKLLTTAAALHLLGPDFRFQTRLYTRGAVQEGVLKGDLVVVGGGDPDISGRYHDGDPCFLFREWAGRLVRLGIRRVQGGIVGDATAFDDEYVHPSWPKNQLEKWYCAPVGALNLNDNCADVTVSAAAEPGRPPRVSVMPDAGYISVVNRCVTTASKAEHLYGFVGRAGPEGIILRGKFWIKGSTMTTSIPVKDPSAFFLEVMKATLEAEGVDVTGDVTVAREPLVLGDDAVLAAAHSSPLGRAVAVANKRSQNLYAEVILKTLGWKQAGRGTFATGAGAAEEFLGKASPNAAGCRISDGSGLSRGSRLSAAAITDVLCWIARRPEIEVFADSLPMAGVDGTLARRLRGDAYRGRVKAKTGTLGSVCTLSGYMDVPGDTLAFSILMNSRRAAVWRMRKAQDAICMEMLDFADRSSAAGKGGR